MLGFYLHFEQTYPVDLKQQLTGLTGASHVLSSSILKTLNFHHLGYSGFPNC